MDQGPEFNIEGICFYCGGKDGIIYLPGMIGGRLDRGAPSQAIGSMEPCPKCKGFMEKGVIIIEIGKDQKPTMNPYRTGRFWVVSVEAFRHAFTGDAAAAALEHRWCFMTDAVVRLVGLNDPLLTRRTS